MHVINPDNYEETGTYTVDWNKNPHHLDLKMSGTDSYSSIMEFMGPGKVHMG